MEGKDKYAVQSLPLETVDVDNNDGGKLLYACMTVTEEFETNTLSSWNVSTSSEKQPASSDDWLPH
jgi:hypothetical protein